MAPHADPHRERARPDQRLVRDTANDPGRGQQHDRVQHEPGGEVGRQDPSLHAA